MIQDAFAEGTEKAAYDALQRPAAPPPPPAPSFSLAGVLKAPFQGIGAGTSKALAFGAEAAGTFGSVMGAYPDAMGVTLTDDQRKQAEAARRKLLTQGPEVSNEVGDLFRARAKQILPDPATTHWSTQMTAGLFDMGTRALGYGMTLGPMAPVAFGGDTAFELSDELKHEGVDVATRTKAGATTGVINAASLVIPMSAATRLRAAGTGVVVGESTMVGQTAATKAILANAGYDKIADRYDPFDPVALGVGLVPGVFGFAFHAPKVEPMKSVRTEAQMREAVRLTPAEQARSDANERSDANLAELRSAVAKEKNQASRAILQAELDKQTAANATDGLARSAVAADPDVVSAARVRQVADVFDAQRLTHDHDVPGMSAHNEAMGQALEQLARGEDVNVLDRLPVERLDPERGAAMIEQLGRDTAGPETELHRVLGGAGEVADPTRRASVADAAGERFNRALERLQHVIDTTGRPEYDLRPAIEQARALVARRPGNSPLEVIHEAAGRNEKLDPSVHNLLIGSRVRDQVPSLIDEYARRVAQLRPDQRVPMGDLIADAVEATNNPRRHLYDPDMLMRIDGLEEAAPAGDVVWRVQNEAAAEIKDAHLLQVAAECLLGLT